MAVTLTPTQIIRLKELDAAEDEQHIAFDSPAERNQFFQRLERELVQKGKKRLMELRNVSRRPALSRIESRLVEVLTQHSFVQVVTPILLAKGLLKRMSITEDHPLYSQVFWIGARKCLRPMLAPNLYFLFKDLLRLWEKPVHLFEVGPCFRKESEGANHLSEFTMLNLVEMGLAGEDRERKMEEMVALVMSAVGIGEYRFSKAESEVYGTTLDVLVGEPGIEVGSGAMGPHPLDHAWNIVDPWVGIGFGLERLLMVKEKKKNLKSIGRSLTYLNGVRLNL